MMNINDWHRMVSKSAQLYTIVKNSSNREEGIENLQKGINKVGLKVDSKIVREVYDRLRLEIPQA